MQCRWRIEQQGAWRQKEISGRALGRVETAKFLLPIFAPRFYRRLPCWNAKPVTPNPTEPYGR